MKTLTSILLLCAFVALCMWLVGCAPTQARGPDAVPQLNASAAKTGALIEAAQRGVTTLAKTAEPTVKAWLEAIGGVLSQAQAEAVHTEELVEVERVQKAAISKRAESAESERDALKRSWGHQLQVWVTRLGILFFILAGFHVAGPFVALFIPGPIGMAISVAARFVNPLGWVSTIADNLWFRKFAPQAAAGVKA